MEILQNLEGFRNSKINHDILVSSILLLHFCSWCIDLGINLPLGTTLLGEIPCQYEILVC